MTANVPPGFPGYFAAIACNCLLYPIHNKSGTNQFDCLFLPSETASILASLSAEPEQLHSILFSKMPLGLQYFV